MINVADERSLQGAPPERRYLTLMFIDLVGYTELSEELDPEDLLALLSRYQQLALTVMERFGGFVASFAGDGVLVYFGYPAAHGNDAERALRAALEMIEGLAATDFPIIRSSNRRLAARIGVHTGLVIVGPQRMSFGGNPHGIVGEAPNLASRIQGEAPPNGIVVSRDTKSLVEDLFEFAPLGERRLKGLSRPIEVFQVMGARPAGESERARRREEHNAMVGRQAALARMLSRWRFTREKSKRQVLVIVADAGLGKTRLVDEFFAHPEVSGVAFAQTQCYEIFANTALFPLSSYLWRRLGLAFGDDEAVRRQKCARLLDEYGLLSEENLQTLASFPGLAARPDVSAAPATQLLRRKQIRLVISLIDCVARKRPTILSYEDVHWLDPSSSELLLELSSALPDAPLLILLTTRSFPKGPTLPATDEVIHLEPLGASDSLELARSLPGAEGLPDDLVARAVEAAEGVPLFVEQLVLSLVEKSERGLHPAGKPAGLPLALAEMMSERLDRRPRGRRIVQAAACLGRSFEPGFLALLLQEDVRHINQTLEPLVDAEILQPKRHGVELRYEFRHALLQRMAHDTMIEADRRATHAKIADTLREQETFPVLPEVVAYHLTEAGAFADAVRSWLEAARQSARQSAHFEAIDHCKRGLALVDRIADENLRRELEIGLEATLCGSLIVTQGPTSLELYRCCERGLELCRAARHTPMIFPFIFAKFTFANCRGRIDEAKTLADLFLSLADREGYEPGRVVGHRLRGMWLLGQGDVAQAKIELQASLDLYSHERDAASVELFGQNPRVHSQSLLALAKFCLGEVESALELGRDILLAADALRHPNSTAIALGYVGCNVFGYCDSPDHLMHSAKRLIFLAEEHGLGGFRAHGFAFLGWALCEQGALNEGIETIGQAVKGFDSVEYRLGLAIHLTNMAEGQRRSGKLEEARASIDRANQIILASGNGWLEPEARRVEALIEAERSPDDRARFLDMLKQAARRAREMDSPVFERRCLRSLCAIGPSIEDMNEEFNARWKQTSHLEDLRSLVNKVVGSPDRFS